ncbi:MAG: ECF transporter S component [Clostridiales bacterium]|nr:ECF transporter S component [Clostridiales bacterium]
METNTNEQLRRVLTLAMLSAMAYVVMLFRVPIVLFLSYEAKDVIITIGGFIFGPLSAVVISLVVSTLEMITVSETGLWGLLMNVLATCAFACPAAFIYKKKRTATGAAIGLVTGVVLMTGVMLLWNYLITPYYMGYPREAVADMLIPYFLPFNLLKGGLNAAITMLLYKPVVTALRRAHMLPQHTDGSRKGKFNPGTVLVSAVVLITCILLLLVLSGKI